ncbi:uncharacterized protein BX663DRAFT_498717 [Cokeromyces recurvatus]|uniref:uncharacterized protein n=1 Tax=Cokeromyces recurvatus TaxID=90255 RepID=UPI00221ED5ED|nr:uncharacterized protein BX663DRAFT_498717 [Cokeromyces recurvatus]KAI7906084.1 hypothetical protein BX663DRAFT_498717 [Cokeromyces recurvatus]
MLFLNNNFLIATAVAILYTNSYVIAQSTATASVTQSAVAPISSTTETNTIPNTKITWKNNYPSGIAKPIPKPEWVALVKDDPALKIKPNILTADGIIQNADPTGNNTHCNWTWDGCVKPTDIVHCKETNVWGTSFDDGPYEITRELLAFLKSIDRKVTFFVVGKQVISMPEVLKEAYDQGHEIGIHTWDHAELTTLSNDMIIGELKWTELAIKEVLGVTPRLMRPPRGDIDDRVRYIVNQLGYTPAMWSVDSQDWRITAGGQTEAGLLGNVTQWINSLPTLKQGGNSLMHDLTNITVNANIKGLALLHPHVTLVPVGQCAGWNNASYAETLSAVPNTTTHMSTTQKSLTATATKATDTIIVPTSSNKDANTSNAFNLVYNPHFFYTLLCLLFIAFYV